jgi:uncharacterized tellurite resistance protein B-like protein
LNEGGDFNSIEVHVSGENVIKSLAKVMIAAAWADGTVAYQEINSLKDLLFQLPGMTASDWAELDIYIETPVGAAERERLVAELQANLKTPEDKALALQALDGLMRADGEVPEEERGAVAEIEAAIQGANPGGLGKLGRLMGRSVSRRTQVVENAPNRERYLDDYVKNKIYYSISRRLELDGNQMDIPDAELRRLSLAGGLMARVAYVDQEIKEGEVNTMIAALRRYMQLPEPQAALVAEVAASEISKGMDYYRLSREFFESTNEDERVRFMDVLFAVADGDGRVSHDEIEEIRTIAIVQKLDHKQFIDAKLKIPRERRAD